MEERFHKIHWLILLAWIGTAILIVIGIRQKEMPLENSQAMSLLDYGLSKGYIKIVQRAAGQPLEITSYNGNPSPQDFVEGTHDKIEFRQDQWRSLERTVKQFVASANWGLGDPFLYEKRDDGVLYVKAFHASDFTYRNPFSGPLSETVETSITSSVAVDQQRRGWRVISQDLVLFLEDASNKDPVKLNLELESSHGACLIGKSFLLQSPGTGELRLSIGSSAVAEDKSKRLQIETVDSRGKVYQLRFKSGEYFIWGGQSFVVYETLGSRRSLGNAEQSSRLTEPERSGSLVFTKPINGRPTRVHVLGDATTNLLGAKLGGYTPYLDGAIKPSEANRIVLTLDPELQLGSFFQLRNTLLKLDGTHYLGRPRRGSLTILDLDRGSIVADVGYPSFEPDQVNARRVLVNRDAIARSPSREVHMAGSTIKVLTVAMGFLLFGHAQAELLPTSINDLAVKQAFQNTYASELTAPLEGGEASVTDEARKQFRQFGGSERVNSECTEVLRRVFLVCPDKNESRVNERIIGPEFGRFFNMSKLDNEFFPEQSVFPILNADSIERFRHYALGTEDTRFTTLRLAAMLGTASKGKVFRPFIVESVLDTSNVVWTPKNQAIGPIDLHSSEAQFRILKMREITLALRRVLMPGGTGLFFTDKDKQQYLGTDDPETDIDEAQTRSSDFGKSGTADYGEPDAFQDSLFVYGHGRYAIAVWLERADVGTVSHPGHRPFERHPAHKLTDQIVRLIESLESSHE